MELTCAERAAFNEVFMINDESHAIEASRFNDLLGCPLKKRRNSKYAERNRREFECKCCGISWFTAWYCPLCHRWGTPKR